MAARADRERVASVLLLAAAACFVTGAAAAQRADASLDLSGTAIRYADSINTSGAVLSPGVRLAWPTATITAAGSLARLGTGSWAVQGRAAASAFTPPWAGLRAELAGDLGGSDREGASTAQFDGLVRLHVMRDRWGVWGGGGGGRAWAGTGTSWRTLAFADAGAWYRLREVTAVLTAAPTWIGDSLRYTDVSLALRLVAGRAELGGNVGVRSGHGLVPTSGGGTAWGTLGAVLWVVPRVGIVLSAGSYPPDLAQGFPNGRFASLGVRISNRALDGRFAERDGDHAAGASGGTAPQSVRDGIAEFAASGEGGRTTIRVRAPGASSVEMASDVTGWAPVPLERMPDGWWAAIIDATPGLHQVSLRIDGGTWIAPPGLVAVKDEFGGAAGIWNVP